ncbi:MAG: hypothetical protein A3J82_06125, partial [Elusimicrobia bacterium RIFOXYA2_FULL_69_6]
RQTFGNIINAAHAKIADVLAHGKALKIEGGVCQLEGEQAESKKRRPEMRIGVVLGDAGGLESEVCSHFGQCSHFLIVEVEGQRVVKSRVVPNGTQHGGGGCQAVGEILKHGVTHVIAGGMGMGAQQKFAQAGVNIFGFSGKAKDGVAKLLSSALPGGIDPCQDHGGDCHHG